MIPQTCCQLVALLFGTALLLVSSTAADQTYECTIEKREDESVCMFRNVVYTTSMTGITFKAPNAKVQHVAFEDSTLDRIPAELLNAFPNLRSLSVPNANLSSVVIPAKLERLYASDNQISQVIVHQTRDTTTMLELILDSNRLHDISNLTRLAKLEILSLSGNRELPIDDTIELGRFKGMDGLRHLLLSDVGAHHLENEQEVSLPALELLDLSSNNLPPSYLSVKVFAPFKSLQILRLAYNQLRELDVLQLTKNNPQLKQIYLEGNEFPCKLLTLMLKHFKKEGIETPVANPNVRCLLGFDKEQGLCCMADSMTQRYAGPVTPRTPPASLATSESPAENTAVRTGAGSAELGTSAVSTTTMAAPTAGGPPAKTDDGHSMASMAPLGNSWLLAGLAAVVLTLMKLNY
uniref:Uncharacterized protein n=1 Tax=Anopheles gambiae TaxID=7165 RepID=A0A1S4H4N6_ANOGA